MPAIYEGSCSACGAVTKRTRGGYEAVLLDEPASTPHAHPEDPYLVILAHPHQSEILSKTGYSYVAVIRAGRLVEAREVFCKSCGRMFEIRRLDAGLAWFGLWGGLGAVALMLAFGVGVGRLVGGEWAGHVAGACFFVFLLAAADQGTGWFVRRQYPERANRVATPVGCPDCGCQRVEQLSLVRHGLTQPARCTKCGERSVQYRTVRDS